VVFPQCIVYAVVRGGFNHARFQGGIDVIDTREVGMRRISVLTLAGAFLLTPPVVRPACCEEKRAAPNVLLIVSDDQGYADAGFQGSKQVPTPNLDRLAHAGLRCTSGYVTHPYCSPSRAGLLTGRCQMRFGHERNPYFDPEDHHEGLPTSETLLPQYLRQAGYATGWIGKWHLGAAPEFWPEHRGFQETFGFLGGGHHYLNWPVKPGTEYNIPIRRNGKPVEVKEHLTVAFGHEAAGFVRRHSGEPWFLYLAFNAPHTPHQPTPERLARFASIGNRQRRAYVAQISLMDDAIGEALDAVRSTGQENRTLVFFFSDNGGPTYVGANNGPLRGCKGTTFEGGVRVPFLVSWPGHLPAGKDYDPTVSSLDVFATALACAGVPMPTDRPHDGVNLVPYLSGEKSGTPHKTLFWREEEQGQWGERDDTLKLIRATKEVDTTGGRYTVRSLPALREQLFDLTADIGEQRDLSAQRPAAFHDMLAKLAAWNKLAVPPAFSGTHGKERDRSSPKPNAAGNSPPTGTTAAPAAVSLARPTPTPQQAAWQDLDFGVLFSYDQRIYEGGRAEYPTPAKVLADPHAYAEQFAPQRLDTDQWLAVAKSLGASYAIFTAKHWLGFCMWQSDANPYSMKSIAWKDGKGDVVKDFTNSCRKYALSAALFTEASEDVRLRVHKFKVGKDSPLSQQEYDRMVARELEELCTRYGALREIWYDMREGPYTVPFRAIIAKHQPTAVFYGPDYRWGGGGEDGQVSDPCWATFSWTAKGNRATLRTGDVNAATWVPARADAPLRYNRMHDWYWHRGHEHGVATLDQLKAMYYGSVGRNAKLIIGLTPDRDGLIPPGDAARCKEFGDWLQKTFGGEPLATTAGHGKEFVLETNGVPPVGHIILQEDICYGERVRQFVVEAENNGAWSKVAAGSCIGHKRIARIESCAARKFRLRITAAVNEPLIRTFALRP
jgi:arylsulfatase A-like enzyme/alpha-L-fucosidase